MKKIGLFVLSILCTTAYGMERKKNWQIFNDLGEAIYLNIKGKNKSYCENKPLRKDDLMRFDINRIEDWPLMIEAYNTDNKQIYSLEIGNIEALENDMLYPLLSLKRGE